MAYQGAAMKYTITSSPRSNLQVSSVNYSAGVASHNDNRHACCIASADIFSASGCHHANYNPGYHM